MKLSKYRMLELKYFCLQYPSFKKDFIKSQSQFFPGGLFVKTKGSPFADPTGNLAAERADLMLKMKAIEEAASECDPYIGGYIFAAVTCGKSFAQMKAQLGLPCERDMYYDRRRRFFELLDIKLAK